MTGRAVLADAEAAVEMVVPQLRGAKWAVYAVLALIVCAALGFLLWWFFIRPAHLAQAAGQAKVEATMSAKATDLAISGQEQSQAAAAQKVEVDVRVQKGQIDVRQAPDAGTEIRGVSDRVQRNVCLWAEAAADPACIALHANPAGVAPAGPDAAGAGRPD